VHDEVARELVMVWRTDTRKIIADRLAAHGFDAQLPADMEACKSHSSSSHCGLIDAAMARRAKSPRRHSSQRVTLRRQTTRFAFADKSSLSTCSKCELLALHYRSTLWRDAQALRGRHGLRLPANASHVAHRPCSHRAD
jgi:hypothetical protein